MLNRNFKSQDAKQSMHVLLRGLLIELLAFFTLTVSIVLLWRENLLLLAIVVGECVVLLSIWHRIHDLSFFVIAAVLGSSAETVFVRFGVWSYANPTFLGIPLWFPLAFGTAALIAERIVYTLLAILKPNSTSQQSTQ